MQLETSSYTIDKTTEAYSNSLIDYLKEKSIISDISGEEDKWLINIMTLIGSNQSMGKGTYPNDVYVLEKQSDEIYIVTYYYDINTEKVELGTLSDTIKEEIIPVTSVYGKLYTDGSLILSSTDYTDSSRTLKKDFGIIENKTDTNYWSGWIEVDGGSMTYSEDVTKVIIYDNIAPETTAYWFADLSNLTTIENVDKLNTINVTDMSEMFSWCESLQSLNLSSFNTSNVTDMSGIFRGCFNLQSINVSNFKTSNVTDMSGMFSSCSNLQNINVSSFNTSNVIDMSNMFAWCESLQSLDLSNFNFDSVTYMTYMFSDCQNLEGDAPEYWKLVTEDTENYIGYPNGKGCFYNCIKLNNYESIPEYWKSESAEA